MGPDEAASALAEADERLRRGAELVWARPRWLYPVISVSAFWGMLWDVPDSWGVWRGVLYLAVGMAILGYALFVRLRPPRPVPLPLGWRISVLTVVLAAGLFAVGFATGSALRSAGVPVPFTLAGLLVGVGAVLLSALWLRPRYRARYVDRVRRGQW